MTISRRTRWILGVVTAGVLAFIYVPLLVVLVNSFNSSKTFSWPPTSFTLEWWQKAADERGRARGAAHEPSRRGSARR